MCPRQFGKHAASYLFAVLTSGCELNRRWAQDVQWSHLYEHVFVVMDELDFELLHAKVLGAESRRQMLQGAELESHLPDNGKNWGAE